jgi:enterochelin esterase-like enzyme
MDVRRKDGHALGAAILAVLLVSIGCGGEPTTFRQLMRSVEGLAPGEQAAVIERYIERHGGTPVIENRSRLIFLAQSRDGVAPRVVGDFNGWANTPEGYDVTVGAMTPFEGTDWWWLQGDAYTNARLEYVLLYDRDTVADPHNPRVISSIVGTRSEIRMPLWRARPEIDDDSASPMGELIADHVTSRALGADRRVWYYLPSGYADSGALYPVVYILDGATWVEGLEVPQILDRLIGRGAAPPVIAVFIDSENRQQEYSRSAAWREFMTAELVPGVDARFRTFPAPEQRVILGSALGAYAALDLAVEFPAVFGAVAAIAPPVQTATLITNQRHARDAVRSLRVFTLGGTYDAIIDGARRLRTALQQTDAAETYLETPEGHNWDMFRGAIAPALTTLLPAQE